MTLIYRLITIAAASGLAVSAAAQTTHKPSGDVLREHHAATVPMTKTTPAAETTEATATPTTVVATSRPAEVPSTTTMASVNAPATAEVPVLIKRPEEANILLPVGTAIRMKLDEAISTEDSKLGDLFSGKVSEDVVVEGKVIIPTGSTLNGHVVRLDQPRRIKGRPAIQLMPETVTMTDGKALPITAVIVDTGDPKHLHVNDEGRIKGPGFTREDKVGFVAGGAAGTVAGTVIRLGTGTWIGAAAGVGFATGRWLIRRHSLELPAGTELIWEISNPVATPTQAQPSTAQGGN